MVRTACGAKQTSKGRNIAGPPLTHQRNNKSRYRGPGERAGGRGRSLPTLGSECVSIDARIDLYETYRKKQEKTNRYILLLVFLGTVRTTEKLEKK